MILRDRMCGRAREAGVQMGTEDTGPLKVAVEVWRCACCNQVWQDRLWDWTPGEEGEAEAKEIYNLC